jgi:hypothetical protein
MYWIVQPVCPSFVRGNYMGLLEPYRPIHHKIPTTGALLASFSSLPNCRPVPVLNESRGLEETPVLAAHAHCCVAMDPGLGHCLGTFLPP